MTSDMGEMFNEMRAERRERRAKLGVECPQGEAPQDERVDPAARSALQGRWLPRSTAKRGTPMTAALDTAEGRRLLEKATSAPWADVHGKHASFIRTPCYSSGEVARCDRWRDEAYGPTAERSKANAALIVYAVNNLPALLSRVAALQTALRDVIEGAIETGSADHCAHIARTALREPSDA